MPEPPPPDGPGLRYRRPPSAIPSFLKAAFDRRPARLRAGQSASRIEGRIDRLKWTPARLKRFRAVCGFPATAALPLSFPHVLAAGLHARMLQRPEFPVRLPGLVHVWHRIDATRLLGADEELAMASWIEGHRLVSSGAEFCLHTSVYAGGEEVWREETGFLARSVERGTGPDPESVELPEEGLRQVAAWPADPGVGRRYALASGDYNPIHLSDASARPFGFPAAIAHGMWTLSRAIAALEADRGRACTGIYVRFRRPVLIPSRLTLVAGPASDGALPFRIAEADGDTVFLDGRWQG